MQGIKAKNVKIRMQYHGGTGKFRIQVGRWVLTRKNYNLGTRGISKVNFPVPWEQSRAQIFALPNT